MIVHQELVYWLNAKSTPATSCSGTGQQNFVFSYLYSDFSKFLQFPADALFVVFPINNLHQSTLISSRPRDNVPRATSTTDTIPLILHFKFWHFLFENLIHLSLHLIIDSLLLLTFLKIFLTAVQLFLKCNDILCN